MIKTHLKKRNVKNTTTKLTKVQRVITTGTFASYLSTLNWLKLKNAAIYPNPLERVM